MKTLNTEPHVQAHTIAIKIIGIIFLIYLIVSWFVVYFTLERKCLKKNSCIECLQGYTGFGKRKQKPFSCFSLTQIVFVFHKNLQKTLETFFISFQMRNAGTFFFACLKHGSVSPDFSDSKSPKIQFDRPLLCRFFSWQTPLQHLYWCFQGVMGHLFDVSLSAYRYYWIASD